MATIKRNFFIIINFISNFSIIKSKYIKDYNNEFRFNTDSKFVALYVKDSELVLSYLNDNLIHHTIALNDASDEILFKVFEYLLTEQVKKKFN